MKYKNYALAGFVFAMMILSSCINFTHKNTGIWFYTYASKGISSEYSLTPASFICLQPDNNYTLDFGKFEYGKWEQNGNTIILHNTTGNTEALPIN